MLDLDDLSGADRAVDVHVAAAPDAHSTAAARRADDDPGRHHHATPGGGHHVTAGTVEARAADVDRSHADHAIGIQVDASADAQLIAAERGDLAFLDHVDTRDGIEVAPVAVGNR